MQQRALGSDGSWQTVGGHPKGNSFSSGAGRGLLAEPEAILGLLAGQEGRLSSSGEGTRPVESVLREEVNSGVDSPLLPSVSRSLMTLSSHWLVCFNVTAESQQDGAGITLCGEKNPLDADRRL